MRIKKNNVLGTWELAESDKTGGRSPHRGAELKKRNKQRLMIVDDESTVRTVFKRTVIREFPELIISEAENGADAVKLFMDEHPGVIIMDLVMPVMDGQKAFYGILEYCEEAKWEMPSVIFCTGYDPSNVVRKLVADDHIHCMLQKPASPRTLVEAITARL